jgi:hypothetical protein
MQIINLTPHPITIQPSGAPAVTIPVSGRIARLDSAQEIDAGVAGVPVVTTRFGRVIGLPEPEEGKVYIVSSIVAQHVRRPDVLAPDTGPTAIRQDGQIVAVTRLQRFV